MVMEDLVLVASLSDGTRASVGIIPPSARVMCNSMAINLHQTEPAVEYHIDRGDVCVVERRMLKFGARSVETRVARSPVFFLGGAHETQSASSQRRF